MNWLLDSWNSLSPRRRWWLLAMTLLVLVGASSGIGIHNGFAYDDVEVIQHNAEVHTFQHWWTLFAHSYWPPAYGSDGYRPLTMLAFAAQWVIGHGAPWVFHATNIALYGAVTIAVFWLSSLLLPTAAAWLVAALFAVHPAHVESVANIVGQSELWVAVFLLAAFGVYLQRRLTRQPLAVKHWVIICLCYAVSLFVKEHAIMLPALIVAAEIIVIRDDQHSLRRRLVALRPPLLALTLIAALYLAARSAVKGGEVSGFVPFVAFLALDLSYVNRVLTMIGVVPEWVRLLLWPARLSSEYAPPSIDIAQGPSVVQLPGLLLLIGILGLAILLWKRRTKTESAVACFGIAWLCLTLLPSSNFIVPAGIIIAERTLFLPSLGAMLAIGALAVWCAKAIRDLHSTGLIRNVRIAAAAFVLGIVVAGTVRSAGRTPVWRDNEHLFRQAVIDAPDSYRAHYMLGVWMFETGRKREGEHSYRHAIALFPYDPAMSYNMALQYQNAGMYEAAIPLYKWTFAIAPNVREGEGRANLAMCYANIDKPVEAREQALLAMRYGGAPLWQLRRLLQYSDSLLGKPGATRQANSLRPDQLAALGGKSPLQSQNTTAPPSATVPSPELNTAPARH
jgi:tetratricopeptide (TPR) repeat protein